jgi:hypothetical protein
LTTINNDWERAVVLSRCRAGLCREGMLAQHYLESIKAPRKAFVPISGGGHFAVFMHSDQFLEELVARVRPLALGH